MSNTESNLNGIVQNTLMEIGNIGAGNAATSLSVMLNTKILMSIPVVEMCDFEELERVVENPESIVVGVFSTISGGFEAVIAFLLTVEDAERFVKLAVGEDANWNTEIGISAISEISNIMIGSYIAALETFTNTKIRYSLPEVCVDIAGAILSVPYIEYSQINDKSLLISSELFVGDYKLDGHIFMISYENSYDFLLDKLGIGGLDG